MGGTVRDPLLDFSGHRVLITGAGSGLGALLAQALAERGASLVLGDLQSAPLNALADSLRAQGASVVAQAGDVSSEATCRALVDAAVEQFGGLDSAVNNAGIAHPFISFEHLDEATLDRQFAVNVKGVMFGMKYQIPAIRAQGGGAILNVSSMAGLGGAPKIGAYAAAKHAVIGLTRTAAVEQARHKLRINAICPYYTHTPMVDEGDLSGTDRDAVQAMMAAGSPMKRLGQPAEIVAVMLMLLSPANTFMTGQAVAVDGGVSAF